jgi:mRNA interferase MazF
VPDRQDIVWIDCNPQVGREMRDVHPFLVLSDHSGWLKNSAIKGSDSTRASRCGTS